MTHLTGKEEPQMELTFTLPNGTRAGIRPTQELRDLTIEQLGLECLAPAKDVSVVFHVPRSEEHTSELQSQSNLVCRLLLEKKKTNTPSRPPANLLDQASAMLTPLSSQS